VALPLASQELWDPHLKLTAGIATNAEDNYVAQNRAYGLALAYKFMPPTSKTYDGNTVIDDKTDIYYAGAMYRYSLWTDGIYLQAGARGTNAKTVRTTTNKSVGLRDKLKADREIKTGWCFGVGYRLTNLWSFELTASSAGFKNLLGDQINSTSVEAALLIHR